MSGKPTGTPGSGIITPVEGGTERLIGRIAARLHAAHFQLPLGDAHTHWLQIDHPHRDYWLNLARVVVDNFNDDNRWAVS